MHGNFKIIPGTAEPRGWGDFRPHSATNFLFSKKVKTYYEKSLFKLSPRFKSLVRPHPPPPPKKKTAKLEKYPAVPCIHVSSSHGFIQSIFLILFVCLFVCLIKKTERTLLRKTVLLETTDSRQINRLTNKTGKRIVTYPEKRITGILFNFSHDGYSRLLLLHRLFWCSG